MRDARFPLQDAPGHPATSRSTTLAWAKCQEFMMMI